MGTLHEDQYTFLIVSHLLLRMRNLSDKFLVSQNTFCVQWLFRNCDVYEKMWKNIVELGRQAGMQAGRQQMTTWHMFIAFWIPKVTNTYT